MISSRKPWAMLTAAEKKISAPMSETHLTVEQMWTPCHPDCTRVPACFHQPHINTHTLTIAGVQSEYAVGFRSFWKSAFPPRSKCRSMPPWSCLAKRNVLLFNPSVMLHPLSCFIKMERNPPLRVPHPAIYRNQGRLCLSTQFGQWNEFHFYLWAS